MLKFNNLGEFSCSSVTLTMPAWILPAAPSPALFRTQHQSRQQGLGGKNGSAFRVPAVPGRMHRPQPHSTAVPGRTVDSCLPRQALRFAYRHHVRDQVGFPCSMEDTRVAQNCGTRRAAETLSRSTDLKTCCHLRIIIIIQFLCIRVEKQGRCMCSFSFYRPGTHALDESGVLVVL